MKHIEEKAIFFTPKANVFICNVTHGARNMKEMLQKFDSHVLVYLVELTQIQGNPQHIQAEHRHPGSCISLFQFTRKMARIASVNHADVVQSQKAPFKDIVAFCIFPVYPPGEIEHQPVKASL